MYTTIVTTSEEYETHIRNEESEDDLLKVEPDLFGISIDPNVSYEDTQPRGPGLKS